MKKILFLLPVFLMICGSAFAQKQPHDIQIERGLDKSKRFIMLSDTVDAKYRFGKYKSYDFDSLKQTIVASARTYKVYTALLTQINTEDPAAVVLENTLGDSVVWSYTDTGFFTATIDGVFPADKTFVVGTFISDDSGPEIFTYHLDQLDTHVINFNVYYNDTPALGVGDLTSGYYASIEIRVYN